jgi:3-oxoacyl-[acyl-carrier protein] reductase
VIALTKSLAKELGPSGIQVNCVAPGVIDTDMNRSLTPQDLAALREETPLGRVGTADQVAEAVWFLCAEPSDFITGQIIGVNGGLVV